jgi:hypothetical protein
MRFGIGLAWHLAPHALVVVAPPIQLLSDYNP